MAEPVLLGPDEGRSIDLGPMGSGSERLSGGQAGDGAGAWEFTLEPGGAPPPPHVHRTVHELMYVLEGDADLTVGDEQRRVGPGGFVYAPPGTLHGVAGEGRVRVLIVASPATTHQGVVDAFERLAAGGPPDPSALAEAFAGQDIEIPGMPGI